MRHDYLLGIIGQSGQQLGVNAAYKQQVSALLNQNFSMVDMADMLEKSPTGVICKSTISWSDLDGSKSCIESGYYHSPREARKHALRSAIRSGWTPPRWWQWWRWDDTRVNLDFTDVQKREG